MYFFKHCLSAIFNPNILNYLRVWESGIQLYKLRTAIMWKTNNHNVVDDDIDDIQNNQGWGWGW